MKFTKKVLKNDKSIVTYDKGTDTYGLRYTELVSPIIKAILELFSTQKREMAAIKEENKRLKEDNIKMKARLDKIELLLHKK